MMDGFDFSQAMVDPWATLSPLERYYVVSIRLRDGQGIFSLIKTELGENDAVTKILGNLRICDANNIKDVRCILLDDMEEYSPSEIKQMMEKVMGEG